MAEICIRHVIWNSKNTDERLSFNLKWFVGFLVIRRITGRRMSDAHAYAHCCRILQCPMIMLFNGTDGKKFGSALKLLQSHNSYSKE
ncbi:hypothetical protein L484_011531 [Morus notabilis]|uniref:Uncharacterized protein n=1 Tax=Morus notabilis TaxID=981085 RepID=W9RDE3_9ROSA|nr:hypothetical protein L484_011531 [Morus notabilis]